MVAYEIPVEGAGVDTAVVVLEGEVLSTSFSDLKISAKDSTHTPVVTISLTVGNPSRIETRLLVVSS